MKGFLFSRIIGAGMGLLAASTALALGPHISEFLAENHGGLRDEDGETSDWIEIQHPGAAPLSLQGWSLTDDPRDLRKWRFPAVTLGPGGYLVVFASGKDRIAAGAPLHTNFKLEADGDYLALVEPNGTIATEFAPEYPRQREDVSYGSGFEVLPGPLVSAGAPGKLLVPQNGDLGLSWTGSASDEPFDDSPAAGWLAVSAGIGFPGGAANGSGLTPIAYWDFNGTARDQAGNGHDGDIRGAAYTTDAAAPPGTGQCLNFDGVDDRFYAAIDVSETAYSASLWFKADTAGRGVVAVVDQDFGGGGHDRHLYLAGSNIAARVWNNEVIASTGKNYADRRWHHLAHVVGASAGGQRIYVDGMLVASGAKAASDFDWQQGIDIGFSNPPPPRATC